MFSDFRSFSFVVCVFTLLVLRSHAVFDCVFTLVSLRFYAFRFVFQALCVAFSRCVCCVVTLRVLRFYASCSAFSRVCLLRFYAVLRHVVGHTLMYREMP